MPSTRELESLILEAGGYLEKVARHRRYKIGNRVFTLHCGPKQNPRSLANLRSVLRKIEKEKLSEKR